MYFEREDEGIKVPPDSNIDHIKVTFVVLMDPTFNTYALNAFTVLAKST